MLEEVRSIDLKDAELEPRRGHKCDCCRRRLGDRTFDRFWVCAFCWHRLAAKAGRG